MISITASHKASYGILYQFIVVLFKAHIHNLFPLSFNAVETLM